MTLSTRIGEEVTIRDRDVDADVIVPAVVAIRARPVAEVTLPALVTMRARPVADCVVVLVTLPVTSDAVEAVPATTVPPLLISRPVVEVVVTLPPVTGERITPRLLPMVMEPLVMTGVVVAGVVAAAVALRLAVVPVVGFAAAVTPGFWTDDTVGVSEPVLLLVRTGAVVVLPTTTVDPTAGPAANAPTAGAFAALAGVTAVVLPTMVGAAVAAPLFVAAVPTGMPTKASSLPVVMTGTGEELIDEFTVAYGLATRAGF